MRIFIGKNKLPSKNKRVKVGLALGGGGTRGIAHIGVLKAFEENGIDFDFVAGTSVGSIIGASYAYGKSADEILAIAKRLSINRDIKGGRLFIPLKTDGVETLIKKNLGDIDIQDLKKPFAAVATNLVTSDEVVFTKGNLPKIIAGSCAIPAIFVPVAYNDMHLSDGGLQNNIPSDVPRFFGCDYVVAVDVNSTRGGGTNSLKFFEVVMAMIRIMTKTNCVKGYANADIVISPNMKKYNSTKLDDLDEMFEEGYIAGLEAVPKILKLISKKPKRKQKQRFAITSEKKPIII